MVVCGGQVRSCLKLFNPPSSAGLAAWSIMREADAAENTSRPHRWSKRLLSSHRISTSCVTSVALVLGRLDVRLSSFMLVGIVISNDEISLMWVPLIGVWQASWHVCRRRDYCPVYPQGCAFDVLPAGRFAGNRTDNLQTQRKPQTSVRKSAVWRQGVQLFVFLMLSCRKFRKGRVESDRCT